MKKVLVLIVILLLGLLTLNNVKAKEDKTLVIELPSNENGGSQFMIHNSVRNILIMGLFIDPENYVIINGNDKEIIKVNENPGTIYFGLLENVTEEDCLIEVNDKLIERLENSSNPLIPNFDFKDFDLLEDYNYIKFEVKNMENKESNDLYVVDFVKESVYDLTYFDFMFLEFSSLYYTNAQQISEFKNNNDKTLVEIVEDVKYTYNEETDVRNREVLSVNVNVSDDVTKDDDVIIPVTNDLIKVARSYGVNLNNYSNLIIKFSDYDYSNVQDYIFDMKDINKDNNTIIDLLSFISNGRYTDKIGSNIKNIIKNDEGKDILSTMIYLKNNNVRNIDFKVGENVTYEDNLIVDVKDVLNRMFNLLNFNINKIAIKYADPVFIEGNGQIHNVKNKEQLSFRLNIPYEKFQEYGKVYVDDKIVDSKNYNVTEGSTIITLNEDYVSSLGKGDHNIKVEMIDGEITAKFSVVDKVEIITPIVDAVNRMIENPETGDNLILITILLLMLSSFGIIVFKKKRI